MSYIIILLTLYKNCPITHARYSSNSSRKILRILILYKNSQSRHSYFVQKFKILTLIESLRCFWSAADTINNKWLSSSTVSICNSITTTLIQHHTHHLIITISHHHNISSSQYLIITISHHHTISSSQYLIITLSRHPNISSSQYHQH